MSFYPVRWLSVFPNHQMTLPQTFCQHVGFRNQAECILNQSHLILRPLDVSSLTQEVQILNEKEKEIQLEMNEIEQRLKMKRAYLESVKQQAAEDARNSAPKFGLG